MQFEKVLILYKKSYWLDKKMILNENAILFTLGAYGVL